MSKTKQNTPECRTSKKGQLSERVRAVVEEHGSIYDFGKGLSLTTLGPNPAWDCNIREALNELFKLDS